MCVKQADDCHIAEGDLSDEIFKALEPALPTLEALILNGVGEPLLHPGLERFIKRAKQLMPSGSWVGFQSNGLLLSEQRALSLLDAGLDKICLSLDAISPDLFKKVRQGGEIVAIEKAFSAIIKAQTALQRPEFQVGVEFVLMRSNLQELLPAVHWAAVRGASFVLITHTLPYDAMHADEAAYETCSKEAVELFQDWQNKAEALSLDLSLYPITLWKYAKTADEQRLIDLVNAMKDEAEQKGISLDLKKLFALDLQQLNQVTAVFTEARKIAKEHNIELKLPELMLKEKRQCDFVEEGSAFVSWDGGITPVISSGITTNALPVAGNRTLSRNLSAAWPSKAFWKSGTHMSSEVSGVMSSLMSIPTVPAAAWPPAITFKRTSSSRTVTSRMNPAAAVCGAWVSFNVCDNLSRITGGFGQEAWLCSFLQKPLLLVIQAPTITSAPPCSKVRDTGSSRISRPNSMANNGTKLMKTPDRTAPISWIDW
jgi:putative metalloenzyme radical SAM/SPASM domain maturase